MDKKKNNFSLFKNLNNKSKIKKIGIISCVFVMFIAFTFLLKNVIYNFNALALVNGSSYDLKNATRAYFNAQVTKNNSQADCILLENYDANGNKTYGLIDTGLDPASHTELKTQDGKSTVVRDFLTKHGVNKLEFLMITHNHTDHIGDALSVLDNFEVGNLYIKEFDSSYSNGVQSYYENVILKAIEKDINVIGVSYQSLTDGNISPKRTETFKTKINDAKQEKFHSFNESNTEFTLGSARLKIFNWELFDENGNQYITGESTTKKEGNSIMDENNNSLTLLLTQGKKRVFFAGDMNNFAGSTNEVDETGQTGRIGDEDRVKDLVGDVDLLKLGHHGYTGSNTINYLNTLKPEYAVITNDVGSGDVNTIDWLNNNKVNYLYTTQDEYGISATITEDKVYLGFDSSGYKRLNDKVYYVEEEKLNQDYASTALEVSYVDKEVEVSNFGDLKKVIDDNKKEVVSVDAASAKLYKLIIKLKPGDYSANEKISVSLQQNIVLHTDDKIEIKRGESLKNDPLFYVEGKLQLSEKDKMKGTITLDGNKDKVVATKALISVDFGVLDLYENVVLQNNINKNEGKTISSTNAYRYDARGSGIYSRGSTINIDGAVIQKNSQDITANMSNKLAGNIGYGITFNALGSGIYLELNSVLNMYSGQIINNTALNNSSLTKTGENKTNLVKGRGWIPQRINGVGIYASGSEVNLLGGKITGNSATNNSSISLNSNVTGSLNVLNLGIYGVGVFAESSRKLNIDGDVKIMGNEATLNTKVSLNGAIASDNLSTAIRGQQVYAIKTPVKISGATISGKKEDGTNATSTNNFKPLEADKDKLNLASHAGVMFNEVLYEIEDTKISNNKITGTGLGGGIYITNSEGVIKNSNISDNVITDGLGGGIYFDYHSKCVMSDSNINNNNALSGGGIYLNNNSRLELNNVNLKKNNAHNDVNPQENGVGGAVRVNNSKLVLNSGEITDNTARSGGGVYFDGGTFYHNGGKVDRNTIDNITPSDKISKDEVAPTLERETDFDLNWTNKDVLVTIKASDEETGIKEVSVNGEVLKGNNGEYLYVVRENGTYEIKAIDNADNTSTNELVMSKIDKESPIIGGVSNQETYSSDVIIDAIDSGSGIKKVNLKKDNKDISYSVGSPISQSGSYNVTIEDNASNISKASFKIDKTLKDANVLVTGLSNTWTRSYQMIKISLNKNTYKKVTINDAEVRLTNDSYTITATENKTYTVKITDLEDNVITKTISVTNLDKVAPAIYGAVNNGVYNKKVNISVSDGQSGISQVSIIKDGKETKYNQSNIEVSENGNYQVKATDKVGNETSLSFKVEVPVVNNEVPNDNSNDLDNTQYQDNGYEPGDEEVQDYEYEEDDDEDEDVNEEIQENFESKKKSSMFKKIGIPIIIIVLAGVGIFAFKKIKENEF